MLVKINLPNIWAFPFATDVFNPRNNNCYLFIFLEINK